MQSTPLTLAARILDSHPAALRKAINQFQIVERDTRHRRLIPNDVLALFRRTKAASGYLYPAWVRSRDDLLAAAAQIPPHEITELEKRAPRLGPAASHVLVSTKPTGTSAKKGVIDDSNSRYPGRRQT